MTKHTLKAAITDGEVTADRIDNVGPDTLDYHVTDLRLGTWTCSCGESDMGREEAVGHLRGT